MKLFDAWTALPAGPATLAAKTSSRIMPAITTRGPDGRLRVILLEPIAVPSSDPADLQRATQAIADAVADTIRPAPEQWYSFKPIWPATEAEAADLERRALAMQAGRPDPGPGSRSAARRGRPGRGRPGRGRAVTIRGRLMLAASWLACRLPEGPLYGFAELVGELWYRLTPGRAAQARRNLRRVSRVAGRVRSRKPRACVLPPPTRERSSDWCAPPTAMPPATTWRSRATRA